MRRRPLFAASALAVSAWLIGPAAPQAGISAEQYERMFPQAPRALSATLEGRKVRLRWSPPPASSADRPDRRFAHYRVFRIHGGEEFVVADTTRTQTSDSPGPGRATYVVATVQPSGMVGARSDPAEIIVP